MKFPFSLRLTSLRKATRDVPRPQDDRDRKKIRVDTMMLIVALLAAIFTYYQANVAERARKDAKEIARDQLTQAKTQFDEQRADSAEDTEQTLALAKKSADAAKRSADAAHSAVKTQREAFEMQERPWIGVDRVEFEASRANGNDHVTVNLYARVSGNSPALDLTTGVKASLGIQGVPDATDFGREVAQVPSLLSGSTPILVYDLSRESPPKPHVSDLVMVEGVISYWDIFKSTVHFTHVCYVGYFEPGKHALAPCTAGNEIE